MMHPGDGYVQSCDLDFDTVLNELGGVVLDDAVAAPPPALPVVLQTPSPMQSPSIQGPIGQDAQPEVQRMLQQQEPQPEVQLIQHQGPNPRLQRMLQQQEPHPEVQRMLMLQLQQQQQQPEPSSSQRAPTGPPVPEVLFNMTYLAEDGGFRLHREGPEIVVLSDNRIVGETPSNRRSTTTRTTKTTTTKAKPTPHRTSLASMQLDSYAIYGMDDSYWTSGGLRSGPYWESASKGLDDEQAYEVMIMLKVRMQRVRVPILKNESLLYLLCSVKHRHAFFMFQYAGILYNRGLKVSCRPERDVFERRMLTYLGGGWNRLRVTQLVRKLRDTLGGGGFPLLDHHMRMSPRDERSVTAKRSKKSKRVAGVVGEKRHFI
jgi:hypothetical protein